MTSVIKKLDHGALVRRAVRWLWNTRRCSVVVTELRPIRASEVPDAVGWQWNISESILIECKASRSDFNMDQFKHARGLHYADAALGTHRYYMAVPGLIREDELPARWGLLEVHGGGVRVAVKAKRWPCHSDRIAYEANLLISQLKKYQSEERMADRFAVTDSAPA